MDETLQEFASKGNMLWPSFERLESRICLDGTGPELWFVGMDEPVWDLAPTADGHVLAALQHGVERFGPDVPSGARAGTKRAMRVADAGSGRVVALGYDGDVERYGPDGELDASFGVGGVVAGSTTIQGGRWTALGVGPTDKVTIARRVAGKAIALMRYDSHGTPDRTFGRRGLAMLSLGKSFDDGSITGVWEGSQGEELVAGVFSRGTGADLHSWFVAAKTTPQGQLDPSFGNGGVVILAGAEPQAIGSALAGQDLLIASGGGAEGVIVRLTSRGSIDRTFGINGFARHSAAGEFGGFGGFAASADGTMFLSGTHLLRLDQNGNEMGIVTPDLGPRASRGYWFSAGYPVTGLADGSVVMEADFTVYPDPQKNVYSPTYLFHYGPEDWGESAYPAQIPEAGDRIEAENFDYGGEGVAYHDVNSANLGGEYRTTGVDIESANSGYYVSSARAGEWINYTAEVAPGDYQLEVRVASDGAGGIFHVEADGKDISGPLTVPNGGGWANFGTIGVAQVHLPDGTQKLTLVMDQNGPTGAVGNFDWFSFAPLGQLTPATAAAVELPAIIQAEAFDDGVEGVAYHDSDAINSGGAGRSTPVDVSADPAAVEGLALVDTHAGEWVSYSVDSPVENVYAVAVRLRASGGGSLHLEVDGMPAGQAISVPNTNGHWGNLSAGDIDMAQGRHVIRVMFDQAGQDGSVADIDQLVFTARRTPAAGVPANLPGLVQMEAFDRGPAGLAYSWQGPVELGQAAGAVFVENATAGDWLAYTTTKTGTRRMDLEMRIEPAATGGVLHVEVDGADVTGPIQTGTTAGDWEVLRVNGIEMNPGEHLIRVMIDQGSVAGMDWMRCTNEPDGELNPDFGTHGVVQLAAGQTIWRIGMQPDGKVIVAVMTDNDYVDMTLWRLNLDGTWDPTFGDGGSLTVARGKISVGPQGQIVVAHAESTRAVLTQYTPDGQLDSSFGDGGTAFDPAGGGSWMLLWAPGGWIYDVGLSSGLTFQHVVVARLSSDGRSEWSQDAGLALNDKIAGALVLPDGRLAVVTGGSTTDDWMYNSPSLNIALFTPDGSMQKIVQSSVGGTFPDNTQGSVGPVLMGDGTLLLYNIDDREFKRFDLDGHLVASWRMPDVGRPVSIAGLALDQDGRIIVAGETEPIASSDRTNDLFVARLNDNGELDATFADGGVQFIDLGEEEYLGQVIIRPDGNLVLSGQSGPLFADGQGEMISVINLRRPG